MEQIAAVETLLLTVNDLNPTEYNHFTPYCVLMLVKCIFYTACQQKLICGSLYTCPCQTHQ